MANFSYFISCYGYLAIFVLLMVGIFGIPLPDELLLCFIGYLVFHEEMRFWPATLVVMAGSLVGISLNYVVGRTIGARLCQGLAYFFPNKLAKLRQVTVWMDRSGGVVLFLAYFLPGLRHWATVGAGVLKVSPTVGLLFVFPAAMIWSLTFISLGYHLAQAGAYCPQNFSPFLPVLSGVIVLGGGLGYWFFRKKDGWRCGSSQKLTP